MMQVAPDWSRRWTAAQAEAELKMDSGNAPPFKFKGAGVYLTLTDTLIVVPDVEGRVGFRHPSGRQNAWPANQLFWFHVYNVLFEDTVFSQICLAPVRQDDR